MKKLFNWLHIIIALILSSFFIYECTIVIAANIPYLERIPYTEEQKLDLQHYIITEYDKLHVIDLDNSEIKIEIQKIIKPHFYIERTHQVNRSTTNIVLRLITIEDNIDSYRYAYTLIHEYIHLDKLIANERLTDFLSIKLLYESDNLFLKKSAYYITYFKLNYDNGNEYDCTDQLIKYFLKNFEI